VHVEADKDARVSISLLKGLNEATRYYREVEPFVWRDADSGWRLAAKVVDGKVVRFSADEVSPFMVFEPAPWWRSPAWLQPAAAVAIGACFLTALLWPVAVIVRRRLRVSLGLTGPAARARLVSRLAAVAISVVTAGWLTVIVVGLSKLDFLGPRIDPLLIALSLLSIVAYLGGAAAMVWAAYVAWVTGLPWMARIWTSVLAVSALVVLWTAWVYHAMSLGNTSY
jgi:hypothetical protein